MSSSLPRWDDDQFDLVQVLSRQPPVVRSRMQQSVLTQPSVLTCPEDTVLPQTSQTSVSYSPSAPSCTMIPEPQGQDVT